MSVRQFWVYLIATNVFYMGFVLGGAFNAAPGLMLIVGLGLSLLWYFSPAITARIRGHRQTLAIFWFTFFLGWTFLGWVVALVWSCTADIRAGVQGA